MGELKGRQAEPGLGHQQQLMTMPAEKYQTSLKAIQVQLAEERQAARERDAEHRAENRALRQQLNEALRAQADNTQTSQSQVIALAGLQVANSVVPAPSTRPLSPMGTEHDMHSAMLSVL